MTPPPVVLVHGAGSTHRHNWGGSGWTDVLADEGRTVVPFELPGHGEAPPLADADGVEAAGDVERLLALLAADGGPAPVDAIGFSAGARLLLRAAARHPAAFRRLVLLGVGDNLLRPGDGSAAWLVNVLEAPAEPAEPPARTVWRLVASAGNDRAAVAAYLRRPVPALTAGDLAALDLPVLVVLGDRDPGAPGDDLVAALPDARLVSLTGLDHFGTTSDVRAMEAATRFLDAEA